MEPRQLVTASKRVSYLLRHKLELGPGGWVDVDELLARADLPRAELEEVVARNDKQRFAFDPSGTRIRASQGHSVPVDLQLEPVTPPATLFHGTSEDRVQQILRDGLRPMRRQHVHLSPDRETARRVGARHGRPVVLEVAAGEMSQPFYLSDNGVWLTASVPPQFLRG